MKKTVSIVILLFFWGSIALIGVFGSEVFSHPDYLITKVTSIEFDVPAMYQQSGMQVTADSINNAGQQVIRATRTVVNSAFKIVWKVLPDNATKKEVSIIVSTLPEGVTVDVNEQSPTYGSVMFTQPLGERRIVVLVFKSTDGTEKTNTILIAVD